MHLSHDQQYTEYWSYTGSESIYLSALNNSPLDRKAAISQTISSDAFREWKVLYFD